jgi:hypothetical protein
MVEAILQDLLQIAKNQEATDKKASEFSCELDSCDPDIVPNREQGRRTAGAIPVIEIPVQRPE